MDDEGVQDATSATVGANAAASGDGTAPRHARGVVGAAASSADLFDLLEKLVPSREQGEEPAAYAARLAKAADKKERTALVAANAHRVGVALTLLDARDAELPADASDKVVGKWKHKVAQEMGYSKRHVQNFLTLGNAVRGAQAKREIGFPADLLNRPLVKVALAISNVLAGRKPEISPERPTPSEEKLISSWSSRAGTLVARLPAEPLPSAWRPAVEDHVEAVMAKLYPAVPLDPRYPTDAEAEALRLMPYPGGKSYIAQMIVRAIGMPLHPTCQFREPFVGGGSVTLTMIARGLVKRVRINDINRGVHTLWREVYHRPQPLLDRVDALTAKQGEVVGMPSEVAADYHIKRLSLGLEGTELALSELVLRYCSYNSNALKGRSRLGIDRRWKPDLVKRRISVAHNLLKRVDVEITQDDVKQVVLADDGTPRFVYLDPPYVEQGPDLYAQAFGEPEHRDLAAVLASPEAPPWLMSYDRHWLVWVSYPPSEFVFVRIPNPAMPTPKRPPDLHRDVVGVPPPGYVPEDTVREVVELAVTDVLAGTPVDQAVKDAVKQVGYLGLKPGRNKRKSPYKDEWLIYPVKYATGDVRNVSGKPDTYWNPEKDLAFGGGPNLIAGLFGVGWGAAASGTPVSGQADP